MQMTMQMMMKNRNPKAGRTGSSFGRVSYLSALLTLLSAALGASAVADDVVIEERDVSAFTGIVLRGSGDLYITQGDSESLTITAEPKVLEVLTTEVRDGVLTIGRKKGSKVRTREGIRFDVSVRELERLGMAGSGDAFMSRVEGDELTINISGSSDIEFGEVLLEALRVTISGSGDMEIEQLDAGNINSSISGSGEIQLAGRADVQSISVSGSGDYIAPDLIGRDVTATVIGSGQVEVHASESLDVTVTGSGDVIYRGQPEVSLRVSGSGKVRSANGD
jgi:hypothetical protein